MNHKARALTVLFALSVLAACATRSYVPARVAAPPDAEREIPWTEGYAAIAESGFHSAAREPRSTFSVDVDTASYSNVRRFLSYGERPPTDAVRIEELINYFDYAYPKPAGEHPIAISSELATSPFDEHCQLLRVALAANDTSRKPPQPKNLVFLIDVSGSMHDANKLPLVKASLSLLLAQLGERDRVSLVVYAGASGVVLLPTAGDQRGRIEAAIADLEAGGSTNGASGIELAYELAQQSFIRGGVNRVILATDGDFNVGVTSHDELLDLIERRRRGGVYLTVLGYGMGNVKDDTMELLADHGNGNYAYIDTLAEARKVLVEQLGATLGIVAEDTKLQLTWDPSQVRRYRLIGYENRTLEDRDFADDAKDAGDLGDGHRVTALYEIELVENADEARPLVTIEARYKRPGAAESMLLSLPVRVRPVDLEDASEDLRFASAVAGFGMLLRGSTLRGQLGFDDVLRIAGDSIGRDPYGYRRELVDLVAQAKTLYEN